MRSPIFTLSVIALALAGCVSTGAKVDPTTAASLKVGEHTCADVTARLGVPTTDSTATANGQRTVVYTYSEAELRPASYIPLVSLFSGGIDSKATSYAFVCDKTGKIVDSAVANTTQNTNTGLLHGLTEVENR